MLSRYSSLYLYSVSCQSIVVPLHDNNIVCYYARLLGDGGHHNFFRQQKKNIIFAPTTGVSWAVYERKTYLCPWLCPTQPGSSYYYLLTRAGSGAPHWLLTGVLMSSVLTQKFDCMSFRCHFPAGDPTHVRINRAYAAFPFKVSPTTYIHYRWQQL